MRTAKRSRHVDAITRKHSVQLRRAATPAENQLWLELRSHKLNGLKFRRQHPISGYIVDFCNVTHRLVIEVDGDTHAGNEQYDEQRAAKLNSLGYRVIRFTNEDVTLRLPSVLGKIVDVCLGNPPSIPPKERGANMPSPKLKKETAQASIPAKGITWNTALYDNRHNYVTKYGEAVLDLLAPQAGERILDIGCGTGHLTQKIAECGAHAIGIDSSIDMIATAREKYPALEFSVGDATHFAFDAPFDAVFSNATLHWVKPPEAAAKCIAQVLKPGGRFVAEFGGHGNIGNIAQAVRLAYAEVTGEDRPHAWFFPSIGEYAPLLEAHGLEVQVAWLFDRPTPLDGDDGMHSWLRMFGGGMLRGVPTDLFDRVTAKAERTLKKTNYKDGKWFADYRRIRVVARKK